MKGDKNGACLDWDKGSKLNPNNTKFKNIIKDNCD